MQSTKRYLKNLDKKQLRKLFELCELTPLEKWIVIYAFIEDRLVKNTCDRLSMSESKYHTMMGQVLIKIEYKIKEYDKIRSF